MLVMLVDDMVYVLQYGLPTTASLLAVEVAVLATPKSASLTVPSLLVRRFAPLMSRWMTPCSCRYTSPSRTCAIYTATRFSGNLPNRLMMLCRDPFSQNLGEDKQQCSTHAMACVCVCARRARCHEGLGRLIRSQVDLVSVARACTTEIGTHSRMMHRYSRSFTKPLYFTMLGCCRRDERDACACAAFTNIQVLEQVNFRLYVGQHHTSHDRMRATHHDLAQLRLGDIAECDLLDGDSLASGPVEGACVQDVSDGN